MAPDIDVPYRSARASGAAWATLSNERTPPPLVPGRAMGTRFTISFEMLVLTELDPTSTVGASLVR